jgi:hypothetical protein
MKAKLPRAVPIPPACDNRERLEFAKAFPRTPTFNAQSASASYGATGAKFQIDMD